jgi:hypothetical protein
MKQVSFTLPLEENVIKLLPPGTYKITVTGLTKGTVSVEPRNAANNGWDPATTFTATDSGKIGSKSDVINANGQVRCSISGEANPGSCKVRISA